MPRRSRRKSAAAPAAAEEHLDIRAVENELFDHLRPLKREFDGEVAAVGKAEEAGFLDALAVEHALEVVRHQVEGQALRATVGRAVSPAVHRNHAHEAGELGNLRVPVGTVLPVSVQQNKRTSPSDVVAGNACISAVNIFRFVPEHNPSYLSLFSQPSMCKYVSIV